MNIIKTFLATAACALAISVRAGIGYSVYATGNQQYSTSTTNYAVITEETSVSNPLIASSEGIPTLTYVNATGINANALLQFWAPTNPPCGLTVTNFGVTNIVTSTNGLAVGCLLVFEHLGTPKSYELGILASINPTPWTTNTNTPGQTNYTWSINTALATANTYYANDIIWPMQWYKGSIPVGNATLSLTGPGIICGERRKPFLITSSTGSATNTATINAVCATFIP